MRPELISGQTLMKYETRTQFKSDDQKNKFQKSSRTSKKN
jgi:hypothetical protein